MIDSLGSEVNSSTCPIYYGMCSTVHNKAAKYRLRTLIACLKFKYAHLLPYFRNIDVSTLYLFQIIEIVNFIISNTAIICKEL